MSALLQWVNAAPDNAATMRARLSSRKRPIPVVTAAPADGTLSRISLMMGKTLPADNRVVGEVMWRAGGPKAQTPSRDVKLTFAQIAPPPGSMVLCAASTQMVVSIRHAKR
ncbi:hypothetical protein ACNKHO_22415 [Shigella flexneri]